MHDCPACRVPLHGYEEVCPSCGTRQYVQKRGKGFGSSFRPEQPGVNWTPFIITFIVIGAVLLFGFFSSPLGKVLTQGPPPEDPMAKLSYIDARNIIEAEIAKGLSNNGAEGKFSWVDMTTNAPVDKSVDQNIQLTVDTSLPSPDLRRSIIDPIKDYMEKGKVMTLIMNDAKTHATWTYNVTPAQPIGDPENQ